MANKISAAIRIKVVKAEIRATIRSELRSGKCEISESGWYAADAREMAVVKPHDDTQAFYVDVARIRLYNKLGIKGWYYPEPGWWEHLT
jgi:hypothetical protein